MNASLTPLAPITCLQSVQFVSLLRDAELSSTDLARLEHHAQSCTRCQTARQQFEILHTGLDTLLSRPVASVKTPSNSDAHARRPTELNPHRRRWLGWLTGTGLGAVAGAGTGIWWTGAALQTAQSSDEVVAHRIAQYQALYVRETVQDMPHPEHQAHEVFRQWSQQATHAPRIQGAPDLKNFGLRLVRAQRLALEQNPILQWVYLPAQGHPVALCAMANSDAAQAQTSPQLFSESGMRGMHWYQTHILWVLVAPQATWSGSRVMALQQQIARQLT